MTGPAEPQRGQHVNTPTCGAGGGAGAPGARLRALAEGVLYDPRAPSRLNRRKKKASGPDVCERRPSWPTEKARGRRASGARSSRCDLTCQIHSGVGAPGVCEAGASASSSGSWRFGPVAARQMGRGFHLRPRVSGWKRAREMCRRSGETWSVGASRTGSVFKTSRSTAEGEARHLDACKALWKCAVSQWG